MIFKNKQIFIYIVLVYLYIIMKYQVSSHIYLYDDVDDSSGGDDKQINCYITNSWVKFLIKINQSI